MKELLLMNRKEIDRVSVLDQVIAKKLKQGDAARKLEITTLQLRRILRRYRVDGPTALINKSRGKVSNNILKVSIDKLYLSFRLKMHRTFT